MIKNKKSKTTIIAEIGVNHDGNIKKAKKLISVAKNCGADYVKIQTFNPERLIVKKLTKSKYQIKKTNKDESLFKMLKNLSFTFKQTKELFEYSKKIKIKLISTPFDFESVDMLNKFGVSLFKVSSGDVNNFPLLEYILKKKKPVIISTGRTYLKEIKETVKFLENKKIKDLTILHCTSLYPTRLNEMNINCIKTLMKNFKYKIGLSDHSLSLIPPVAAIVLGANTIEKHLTLSRNDEGPDHSSSLEPNEFKQMVKDIRDLSYILGKFEKKPINKEMEGRKKNRRGLYASKNIKKNSILKASDIAIKRPTSFFKPRDYYKIIGKKILNDIKIDEPFSNNNIRNK